MQRRHEGLVKRDIRGQQIWCDARADGIVRMKEDVRHHALKLPSRACLAAPFRCALMRFSLAIFSYCEERFT